MTFFAKKCTLRMGILERERYMMAKAEMTSISTKMDYSYYVKGAFSSPRNNLYSLRE